MQLAFIYKLKYWNLIIDSLLSAYYVLNITLIKSKYCGYLS